MDIFCILDIINFLLNLLISVIFLKISYKNS